MNPGSALTSTAPLPGLHFDNSYHRLDPGLFAEVAPTPVAAPRLVLYNGELGQSLGLLDPDPEVAAQVFSGNRLLPGSQPLAQAYAGHQFGHATMLGDGRAILLGEHLAPDGRRLDLQLKGAGRTPFSRGGDGRGALGPMLREYLVSEAMAALGIPTTRSLAVVTTGEAVLRDRPLPGAILTRVARSHLRVGTFQYAAWQSDPALLPKLLDYTLARHYPELQAADCPALALLEAVMAAQLELVVRWLQVGFVHGVMNTDNTTLSGETIDYGPCAFMDHYHPDTVFSSIDRLGRYAYGNQATIVQWNLERLAESLLPLIDPDRDRAVARATELLERFAPRLHRRWLTMMYDKLGLIGEEEGDEQLVEDWLLLLQQHRLDWTNAHRALMQPERPEEPAWQSQSLVDWYRRWLPRQRRGGEAAQQAMAASNPVLIPRNHRVEAALSQAEAGQLDAFLALHQALSDPWRPRSPEDPLCQPPTEAERVHQTFCGT